MFVPLPPSALPPTLAPSLSSLSLSSPSLLKTVRTPVMHSFPTCSLSLDMTAHQCDVDEACFATTPDTEFQALICEPFQSEEEVVLLFTAQDCPADAYSCVKDTSTSRLQETFLRHVSASGLSESNPPTVFVTSNGVQKNFGTVFEPMVLVQPDSLSAPMLHLHRQAS